MGDYLFSCDYLFCLHDSIPSDTLPQFHFFGFRAYREIRTRPEICVNVTTMTKYLLPGSAATNTGVLGPEIIGSTTLLLTIFVTLASWPVNTALAVALGPAGRGRSRWTDDLFVGGGDNFTWEIQPYRTR